MNKTFKVRIEDTTDGTVEEFESNCLSVISVDEQQRSGKYPTKTISGGNCTNIALFALMRAMDKQKEKIFAKIIGVSLIDLFDGGDE